MKPILKPLIAYCDAVPLDVEDLRTALAHPIENYEDSIDALIYHREEVVHRVNWEIMLTREIRLLEVMSGYVLDYCLEVLDKKIEMPNNEYQLCLRYFWAIGRENASRLLMKEFARMPLGLCVTIAECLKYLSNCDFEFKDECGIALDTFWHMFLLN
ncbi:MAG: hypothetical protein KF743_01450 [Fimbriimonadaceae bacterium]|nr:hypothetical protein [Fimbriimonadaceae bacterium]